MSRKKIPDAVRHFALLEAGYKCANPICRHIITLELHHIIWVKDDGGNEPENLLALCPNCHSMHTAGHIPRSAIQTWKSMLVALNSTNRSTGDLLLVLYADEMRFDQEPEQAHCPARFRFTGDGLPALSGLLTGGLVTISRRYSGAGMFGASMPSFDVRLTESGKRLVEAWRAGVPEGIELALATRSDAKLSSPHAESQIVSPLRGSG